MWGIWVARDSPSKTYISWVIISQPLAGIVCKLTGCSTVCLAVKWALLFYKEIYRSAEESCAARNLDTLDLRIIYLVTKSRHDVTGYISLPNANRHIQYLVWFQHSLNQFLASRKLVVWLLLVISVLGSLNSSAASIVDITIDTLKYLLSISFNGQDGWLRSP